MLKKTTKLVIAALIYAVFRTLTSRKSMVLANPSNLSNAQIKCQVDRTHIKRSGRSWLETILFVFGAIVVACAAWITLPKEAAPPLSPGFAMGAYTADGSVEQISYIESHPKDGKIRANLQVHFLFAAPEKSHQVAVTLTTYDQRIRPIRALIDDHASYRCDNEVKGTVGICGSLPAGASSVYATFDFSGPGLGYIQTNAQVIAQLPVVYVKLPPGTSRIEYWIPSANRYQWSGTMPLTLENSATWHMPSSQTQDRGNLSASGIRSDVMRRDNTATFSAGVLAALAASALIAAVQARPRRDPIVESCQCAPLTSS